MTAREMEAEEGRTPAGPNQPTSRPEDDRAGLESGPEATESRPPSSPESQKAVPPAKQGGRKGRLRAEQEKARDAAARLGGGPIKSYQLEKSVERGMAAGVPTRALALTLNLSPRQTRKYAARVRARWAGQLQGDYLDRALTRLSDDAARMRALGTPKAIATAIQAERVMLDVVDKRVELVGREAENVPREMTVEEMLDELAAGETLAERLRAQVRGEPHLLALASHDESEPVTIDVSAEDLHQDPEVPSVVVEETRVTEREHVVRERVTEVRRTDSRGREVDADGFTSAAQRRAYEASRSTRRYGE